LNSALYEIASFMVMRESTVWRWSHIRPHSDTIIVGCDLKIAVRRPPDIGGIVLNFFNLLVYSKYFKHPALYACGQMTATEKTFIPASQFPRIYVTTRVSLAIYASSLALAFYAGSILPLLYIGLPNIFGSWLMSIYGLPQHAGLAENVLDHHLNCRTV
jgi:fatty acid desaturase